MTGELERILDRCRAALPGWRDVRLEDVAFDAPKGFSSFTMAVRPRVPVDPPAVFYRALEGKENAILDGESEERVFLLLGEAGVAARCHAYESGYRLEACYDGRTLARDDLFDLDVLCGIADQLHRLHALQPTGLPEDDFFTLLHRKWGPLVRRVLEDEIGRFPEHERDVGLALREIRSDATAAKVQRMLPDGPLTFCHNDTYHGNVMRLETGEIRLLDFEFSCLGHRAFDFANLFAETVMRHGLPEPPHFAIAEPEYGDRELRGLIGAYLDHVTFASEADREAELQALVAETRSLIPLSDYMYAMAAIPLAVEPIQRIRFLPYASARFGRFLAAYRDRFGDE